MIKSELIKALADRMTYLPERTVEEAVNQQKSVNNNNSPEYKIQHDKFHF